VAEIDTDEDTILDFNAWRESVGLKPIKRRQVSNKRIRSVSLSDEAYVGLKFLATQFPKFATYGDAPSVSALLEAIGVYELIILDPKGMEEKS